jgi:hypothetical protein
VGLHIRPRRLRLPVLTVPHERRQLQRRRTVPHPVRLLPQQLRRPGQQMRLRLPVRLPPERRLRRRLGRLVLRVQQLLPPEQPRWPYRFDRSSTIAFPQPPVTSTAGQRLVEEQVRQERLLGDLIRVQPAVPRRDLLERVVVDHLDRPRVRVRPRHRVVRPGRVHDLDVLVVARRRQATPRARAVATAARTDAPSRTPSSPAAPTAPGRDLDRAVRHPPRRRAPTR